MTDHRKHAYFECEHCGRTVALLYDDPFPRVLMQCDDGHPSANMTLMGEDSND